MAITINGDKHPYRDGMTIEHILEEKKYSWPLKTVYIGKLKIEKSQWSTTSVKDGDEIRVLHLMAGG